YVCQASVTDPNVLRDPRCLIGKKNGQEPRVLLWGDSKAAQYVGLLDELGKRYDFSVRNAEHSACPPVFADDLGNGVYRESCNRCWRVVRGQLQSGRFDVIVLGGSWGSYGVNERFQREFVSTIEHLLGSGARIV